jgi:ATP-dependent Lhr-like helicase
MPLDRFHPAVAHWFRGAFSAPTQPQLDAWPAIQSGDHALIAAPTGSGKTLAAFLAAIDSLVRQGVEGRLNKGVQVVYVSPLKALSNDVQRNLERPLAGINEELIKLGLPDLEIRAQVRTGDTPQSERAAMRRNPPHILVTTPESLYLLLTSDSGRELLGGARTVIVDEIHAVAATKRGAHLSLSLERLGALCTQPLQRIGLSATQKPIEDVAKFLVGSSSSPVTGSRSPTCRIINTGHIRQRDLALLLPDAPLEPVMSGEVWNNIYDKLAAMVAEHHTTLIFANTRRMVERVTRHLSERIGETNIAAHHGSLAKEQRFDAEQRLKQGKLKAMVATASLELGIDIGDVELVCQLGSPRSIATFLQRVGRANHSVGGIPKGRLLPLSRDDLIECTALLDAVQGGELDRLIFPIAPIDVLCQQIVAEVSAREYGEDELFALVKRSWSYRNLERKEFDDIVAMLADGFATRRGRQSAYLHRDAVNRQLRARRGAKLTAITCGGAIPDNADYHVVLEPQGTLVGTLNEDFAIESNAGDIFQLGNSSYRILRVESGRVRVEDAHGQPPTIPFWLGEAPARTFELSESVGRLRSEVETRLAEITTKTIESAKIALIEHHGLDRVAAEQLVEYLGSAKAVLGELPSQSKIVLERFFDETGGMQLVIHAPFGGRINRAFGLALRKRFCRSFNFELQAAATEDAIILSLGETHSFAVEDVAHYLHSNSVKDVLVQALLDAPMFATRWRWNASIALAIQRMRGGKRTPAAIQRIASEDLISVVFPDQLACQENIRGEREIPDHPLVKQTIGDCLHEAMDIDGLIAVLRGIESGSIKVVARDLPGPSPLAQEILTARPYAFLDDAPLEERRTQAVAARRWLDPQAAQEFGQLNPEAISKVREEAWPDAGNVDELHDALMTLGAIAQDEGEHSHWRLLFEQLAASKRATTLVVGEKEYWIAAECMPMLASIYAGGVFEPAIAAPAPYSNRVWEKESAIVELIRGRMQGIGPATTQSLAASLSLPPDAVDAALLALEAEGFVLRGQFTPQNSSSGQLPAASGQQPSAGSPVALEWCERRLLARIHRYTLQSLRAEIEPVSSADCMRFLLDWQGIARSDKVEGVQALAALVEQLEGFEVPAAAWEADVLPARMHEYDPNWLDSLCLSGRALWARLQAPKSTTAGPVRSTPIGIVSRKQWPLLQTLTSQSEATLDLSHGAKAMRDYLQAHGASFFDEIASGAKLLNAQAEDALAELVAAGLVTSDSYSGLRALIIPQDKKRRMAARGRRIALFGLEDAGRWSLIRRTTSGLSATDVEQVAWILLRRYGVLFRRLLEREADWLPPWHVLVRALRRLEAQGHIRGGRFVAGLPGEQYALPDAVTALRATRRRALNGQLVSLSAADPLNLIGTLLPGPRVPALAGNRILLRDGVPVATYVGGETQVLVDFTPEHEWEARNALLRKQLSHSQVGTT